ncbi:MAG TPA: RNA polymerase sigma factor [Thermoanaerobaculia bacterium]|jgi:RNA polymerase sigma-70 factor (ECF subfamily)|nr:RNA polymerase sigma factor [Thermoanaerobaculia bacterium]
MSDDLADRDVVARFLRGEPEAVATLDGWILRAAWPYQRRLANRWDDVLQDVRLEVTRLLGDGKFRGESSLRTYLWRVVSHTCLDQIRSQTKWQWADLEVLEQDDGRAAGLAQPVAEDAAERDLLLRVVDRASQECRELWRMLVMGLSYREMSLRLQVAEGTLRVRVLRCRERAVASRAELLGSKTAPARNKVVARTPKKSGEATIP